MSEARVTPLSPESPLAQLARRRAEIAEQQILELSVPRWENPTITVKYRPIEHEEIRKVLKAAEKSRPGESKSDALLNGNADLLIKACIGVEAHNPDETWNGFDHELGESLGVEVQTARAACRALFITDGDMLMHARKLGEFSGFVDQDVDDEFEGE
jgi:hypothetical protein